jgi:probable RNA-binding protein EIF1AD
MLCCGVQVEYPDGATTLCLMPAKFNRKLWVRRGGFLMIESSPEAEQDSGSRVTGTITAVLYDEHIKQLKKLPGVW